MTLRTCGFRVWLSAALRCALLGVRIADELLASPLARATWETVVASEMHRSLLSAGRQGELFFWRERQREVDFLIHRAGRFTLAEAKWRELPADRDSEFIRLVCAALPGDSVRRRVVICRCANAYPLWDGVEAVPLGQAGRILP